MMSIYKVLLISGLLHLVTPFQFNSSVIHERLAEAILKIIEDFYSKRVHSLEVTVAYSDRSGLLFTGSILNRVLSSTRDTTAWRVNNFDENVYVPSKYHIFLIDGVQSFDRLSARHNNKAFNFEGFHLIVLRSTSSQLQKSLRHIFQVLFNLFIVNANILHANETGADLYTFFPFSSQHCNKVVPVLYKSFRNESSVRSVDIFPDKLVNFHGCSLNVVTWRYPPHVVLNKLDNGTIIPEGIDGFILARLQSDFNFSINYMIPKTEDERGTIFSNGTAIGAHKTMVDGDGNMSLCAYGHTSYRAKYLTVSQHYYTLNLVIVKPGQPLYTSLERLFFPFDIVVWISLVALFVFSYMLTSAMRFFDSHLLESILGSKTHSPMMQMFVSAIGGNATVLPTANFGRIVFSVWLLVNIIIRSAYQGLLFGFLQSTQTKKIPSTLPGLIKQGYKIYAPRSAVSILESVGIPLSLHEPISIPPDPYFERTQDPNYKRVFVTEYFQVLRYNSENWSRPAVDILPQRLFHLPMVVLYKKGSYLKAPFDRTLGKLIASGLIGHWASRYLNRTAKANQLEANLKPISIVDFSGTFILGSILLLMAIFVFLLELLSIKNKKLQEVIEFNI